MATRGADGAAPIPVWLLVRGLSRSTAHWGELPQALQAALRRQGQPEARVLGLDLPGNGRLWRERSPATIGAMTESLRTQWQDQQRALRATLADRPLALHLLTLSMGGMVGLDWARRHPGELSRLVLVNSSLSGLAPLHWRMRPSAWPTLLRLLALPVGDRACERALHALTSREPASRREATVAAWTALRQAERVSRPNVLRQLVAAARYRVDGPKALAGLGLPVQVICSAGDALVDPRCSQRLAAALGTRPVCHPQAGHDLALDAPDWLIEQVTALAD
ncbi:alpha/beta fold hydrolase [Leptothrix discophora]|uniref:Alpha/beta hydrolase n=1 Tax=Leptothrix discophora TaxID=89 RepID=A0ABT9G6H0_LEPDI|nr:alpha/beta hydrolase [Leptothrix discophora]MDP4302080.1 alpha/beta hydrolase [Leptothrix discophora]